MKILSRRNKFKILRLYLVIRRFLDFEPDCTHCRRGRLKFVFVHEPDRFCEGMRVYECDKCKIEIIADNGRVY